MITKSLRFGDFLHHAYAWQGRWFLVKTFTDEDVNVSEIEDVLNSEDIDS